MYKELSSTTEAKGKAVQSITFSLISDQMALAFMDETFIVFGVACGCDDDVSIFRRDFELEDFGSDIVKSGIITLAEYQQRVEEFRAILRQGREAAERRRYKQLQAKFGD